MPKADLPLVLGGMYQHGVIQADRLHLLLPAMPALHLDIRATDRVDITIHDIGTHQTLLDQRSVTPPTG